MTMLWLLFCAYVASLLGVGLFRSVAVKAACLITASLITIVASLIA